MQDRGGQKSQIWAFFFFDFAKFYGLQDHVGQIVNLSKISKMT